MNPEKIIEFFNMTKHPEGGAFVETYRSNETSHFNNFQGERHYSTGIYFLLRKGERSAFHKIKSDEMWHFYQGDALELFEITPDGKLIRTVIGSDFLSGEKLQYVVPAHHWFASRSLGKYSLVGCTVAPGFDFNDFELAKKSELINKYPEHEMVIQELSQE